MNRVKSIFKQSILVLLVLLLSTNCNKEKLCIVENYSLNTISPYYDGQWQGITVTPDGICYFGSSSHNLIHGGGFFKFDPTKGKVEILAEDLTELVGDDITQYTPQGKIHSPIIKIGNELFMATHLAAYWKEVLDKYAGSYLLSYDIKNDKWNNYGRVKDGFSTYSAIEVDEKRGKVYTMAVSFNPADSLDNKQLYEIDLKTNQKRSLGKINEGKSCFYFFLDDIGRIWISMWQGNGSLYCYDPDVQKIMEYKNAFPEPMNINNDKIEPTFKSRAWTWAQSIEGGKKCLFTMGDFGGGDERLWRFDPHKDITSKEAFEPLCFVGNTFLSVAKGSDRLYFTQRGDNVSSRNYSTEFNRDKPADKKGYHTNNIHLKSVSLNPDDNYKIIDHGLLIDKQGRTAAHIDAIAADDNGNVYMSGSWLIKDNDQPTLQYVFRASDGKTYGALENPDKQVAGGENEIIQTDEDFLPMKRGEFFSRVNVSKDF